MNHLPNVLIVGPSGSGKSTSLRNLNPETTAILNTERKPLPFRGARKFIHASDIDNVKQFTDELKKAMENPVIRTIVIESFTSLFEQVHAYVSVKYEGYELWAQYKNLLYKFLQLTKTSSKVIVWIAIETTDVDANGHMERMADCQGSLKGKVEKEFAIVLWTKVVAGEPGKSSRYMFATNGDGSMRAKTPVDMFDDMYIDNDLSVVLKTINTFYKED